MSVNNLFFIIPTPLPAPEHPIWEECANSYDSTRLSVDESQAVMKLKIGSTEIQSPDYQGATLYTYEQILPILATEVWTPTEE